MMLRDRISTFMKQRGLTRRELADGLDTSPHTLRGWLDLGRTPPSTLGPLLDMLEQCPTVRRRLRLSRGKKLPRGRPFPKGHPFRLNDPRRPQAIAEARARREQSKRA
jgi:transcriptional regulator with XRE-family HTH domain